MDDLNKKLANASLRTKNTSKRTNSTTTHLPKKYNNEDTKPDTSSPSTKLKQHREKLDQLKPATPNSPPPSSTIEDLVHTNQQKQAFSSLCTELTHLTQQYKETRNPTTLAEINTLTPLSTSPTLLLFPHPTIPLSLPQAQLITHELAAIRSKLSSSIDPETILLLKKGLLLSGKKLSYSSLEWFLTWPFHKLSAELGDEELGVRVRHMLENREYALELAYGADGDEEVREKMVEYCFGGYVGRKEVECCNGFRGLEKADFLYIFHGKLEETRRELGILCGCDECGGRLGGEGK